MSGQNLINSNTASTSTPTPKTPSMSRILAAVCKTQTNLSMEAIQFAGLSEKSSGIVSEQNQELQNSSQKGVSVSRIMGWIGMALGLTGAALGVAGGLTKAFASEGSSFADKVSEYGEVFKEGTEMANEGTRSSGEMVVSLNEAHVEKETGLNESMGECNQTTLEMFKSSFEVQNEMASKCRELITADNSTKTYKI